jgi:myo-inositol-1(or 4)-monophosphatase
MASDLEFATDLALRAAELVGDVSEVHHKSSPTDVATNIDLAIHDFITNEIHQRFPDDVVWSEEGSVRVGRRRWIIDPIDGTANFIRSLWPYAICIGLEIDGDYCTGVVYDVVHREMYAASVSGPATAPVSSRRLRESFIGVSGTNRPVELQERLRIVNALAPVCDSVRDMGSTAMQICLVAGGRLDAHVVTNVNEWDVAAAFVVARQAGCAVEGFEAGTPGTHKRAIVGPPELVKQIRNVLAGLPEALHP